MLFRSKDLKRKDTGGGEKRKKRKSLQTSLNPVASGALIHGLGTSIEQKLVTAEEKVKGQVNNVNMRVSSKKRIKVTRPTC